MAFRKPRQNEIIPSNTASSGSLHWVIGVMVYLVFMALSFGLSLNNSVSGWQQDLRNTITIEIAPSDNIDAADDTRPAEILTLLESIEGVMSAELISDDEISALLEPWFGAGDLAAELNVPRLIDVTLNEHGEEQLEDIISTVERSAVGVSVDTHNAWLDDLIRFARSIQLIAILVIGMLILCTISLVVLATRGSLATHHDVVELLHLIGARDDFIAQTFQNHYMSLGMKGGIIGILFGGFTILGLITYLPDLDGNLLPSIRLSAIQILSLVALPFLASALTTVTARLTVLRTLGTIT